MTLRGDERYVAVEGTLLGKTPKAICIEVDGSDGWVPRSCIAHETDKDVDKMDVGDAGQFKIMEWIAIDRGFV